MMPMTLIALLVGCSAPAPAPAPPQPVVQVEAVEPAPTQPKLKLPPAGHVPYSNPNVMSHQGGRKASGDGPTRGANGAAGEEPNDWKWPSNATKPAARNAPRYDANGRRVYRTSELIDDQELSRRLQQRGL